MIILVQLERKQRSIETWPYCCQPVPPGLFFSGIARASRLVCYGWWFGAGKLYSWLLCHAALVSLRRTNRSLHGSNSCNTRPRSHLNLYCGIKTLCLVSGGFIFFFPLEFQFLKSISSCKALSSSDIMAQNACSVWASVSPVLVRV